MRLKKIVVATNLFIFTCLSLAALSGCAHCGYHKAHAASSSAAAKTSNTGVIFAVAIMRPAATANHGARDRVHGQVWFTEEFGKVKIQGTLYGFRPNTTHGFHVHEYGDCLGPDASGAGGHYNPGHEPHGSLNGPHEAGDLMNIIADRYGVAHIDMVIPGISLNGPLNPIIGRSLIVHERADDYVTQPSGNSGPRLACGVIGAAGSLPQWLEKAAQKK